MKIINIDNVSFTEVSHNANIKKQVILKADELGNITNFSKAVFPPGEVAPSHAHSDMIEIFFVLSGHGIIRINHAEHELKEGICAMIKPSESHEIENTSRTSLVILCLGIQSKQENK